MLRPEPETGGALLLPRKAYNRQGESEIRLPSKPFLYTLDQVAHLLNVTEVQLRASFVYFATDTSGPNLKKLLTARNIAALGDTPEWRISEDELKAFLKRKGFKIWYPSFY
jgi:hypothetical protein